MMMKKLITILLASIAIFMSLEASAQKRTITGHVFGDDAKPVVGAVVMISGTDKGTTTDLDGKYSIIATPDDVLIFTCLGYADVNERVEKRKEINVILHEANQQLNDAVVIGYGTQKKDDLTGSVGIVTMEDLNAPSILSADQALQGRIAGVDIMSAGGEPGEGTSIRIRGTRSISASNDPLIVVDGIIDAVESFSDINPDDIKSISVLKDASSTAIYGARGSNGVILVTTRGAENEKLNIQFSANVGLSELPKKLDVMNAQEFAQFRNDYRYLNSGDNNIYYTNPKQKGAGGVSYEDPSSFGQGTDWQDVLTRKAITQNYRVSLQQGDSRSHSFVSFGYDDQQGIIIGSDMKKYMGRIKVDRTLFKWAKAGANVSFSYRHNNLSKATINGSSNRSAVALSPLVAKDAIWNKFDQVGSAPGNYFNSPYLQAINETNFRNITSLIISPFVEFKILKDFTLKSTYTYSLYENEKFYYSPSFMAMAQKSKSGGTAERSDNKKTMQMSETTLTWKKNFRKKHKADVVLGFTAQKDYTDYKYTKGIGYTDDNVGPYNMGNIMDRRNLNESSSATELVRLSALARANYSYSGRYYLTVTGRADGSSNFAAGHKWAFFPAAAFKWTITNEPWMSGAKAAGLTNLSIRLSAGRSGNDSVSSYVSQATLSSGATSWLFGDETSLAMYPSRLGNENLTWEKTDTYNAAIDYSILNGRITGSLEGYFNKTTDLLLTLKNPAQTGFTSRFANAGDTQGYGIEFSITSHNISRPKFNWQTNFNISHNTSIVTDLGYGVDYVSTYGSPLMFGYKVGYPANALWGYQYAGVWHSPEEIEDNNYTHTYYTNTYRCGSAKYVDVNHDGSLDIEDIIYMGSTDPIVSGGLQNTFRIFKFTVDVYFTYSIGGKIYNISENSCLGTSNQNSNKYRYMLDAWHPVRNPDSNIPSAASTQYSSDFFIHDASYLRLKTLSVSYTFNLTKKIKWLRDITLSAYADNLFLLDKYNGFDPDVTSSKTVRRLDNASYPNPRTYMFSIKMRY